MHPLLKKYFNTIKKFFPEEPDRHAVGLDIGVNECKLIEIVESGDSFELVKWAVEPIEKGDVFASAKKALEQVASPGKFLYTSVFGKGTLIRYVDMPKMPLEDLRNSLAIEADKYFPFSHEEIYTDCCMLNGEEKNGKIPVMVAAAKREMIDQRVKLLEDLGFQADFIGLNPIALANIFNVLGIKDELKKDAAVVVLDMGESVSTLTIMLNNMPLFTRDIFIGGRDLTKRISNGLGVSFREAENLKKQAGSRSQEMASACELVVMDIIQELRISFDYFTTEKNTEIDKLFLTGGGSMSEWIPEIFEKNLEIKVCKWNPLASLKIPASIFVEDVNKKSFKLGVALGLALYDYD